MNKFFSAISFSFLSLILVERAVGQTPCVAGQTGGVVWSDYNSNGIRDASETLGIEGVTVNAYDCNGNLVGTATTDYLGQYTFGNIAAGAFPIRVEFSSLPAPYQPTFNGTDGRTDVQFIAAAECGVDFGVNDPSDYCQINPRIALACYAGGTGIGNTSPGVISNTYNASGIPMAYGGSGENPVAAAQIQQVGSVWGSAYDRNTKRLYQSAFAKRHIGFGPGGVSGVYILDFASATGAYAGSFTLQGVAPANGGAALDLGSITRTNVPGAISAGAAGDNQLSDVPTNRSRDLDAFDKVGKVSYGNIETYNNKLWLVNLNQRAIITVDLNNSGNPVPTNGSAAASTITNQYLLSGLAGVPSCNNGIFRPFALSFYGGKGFLGGVCTGENGGTNADATAYVLSFDPANVGAGFTVVQSFSTNYTREPAYGFDASNQIGIGWRAWISSWGTPDEIFGLVSYPQPIVSDIDFDASGNMIVGMKDRFGDQVGYDNYVAVSGSTTVKSIVSGGDIIHLCRNGNSWNIEGTGTCTDSDPGTSWKNMANDGPSGTGEFYYNEHFGGDGFIVHYETATGGTTALRNNNEVVTTVFDPITGGGNGEFNQQGLHWYNTGNGAKTDTYRITTSTSSGKGNGLGEPEAICDPAPLQIGNYVWIDTDHDGVQDPCEQALAGVSVSLYKTVAGVPTFVAVTTTNANGEYYFTGLGTPGETWVSTPGVDSLLPDMEYSIVFGYNGQTSTSQFSAGQLTIGGLNYNLTDADSGEGAAPDQNDNDASLTTIAGGSYPTITLTTGAAGTTNHTYDAGFFFCPTITSPSAAQNICEGSAGTNITVSTNANTANSTRFVRFSSDQSATNGSETATELSTIYAGGTVLGTVTPTGVSNPYTATLTPATAGWSSLSPGTYYVYAIYNPDAGATCRPVQEIIVSIIANPNLTANDITVCESALGAGAVVNLTNLVQNPDGTTLTFHLTQADAMAGTHALLNNTVAPVANTTYYVRSTVAGTNCFSTASITVTVVANPDPTVTTGSLCSGGSIDLATLVTNAAGGALSFYATQANAQAGVNALSSSTVSPVSATNYYVRSTVTASGVSCYGVKEITVTIAPAACGTPTVTGSD